MGWTRGLGSTESLETVKTNVNSMVRRNEGTVET